VQKWTTDGVVEEFLRPIKLEKEYGELFRKENITGDVLLNLTRHDLKEMKITTVGDRLYIDACLVRWRARSIF
jgi:hypothetical protein